MDSICDIINRYIQFSELKSDLEKSYSINDKLKRIKKNQLHEINDILTNLYNKFIEKIKLMDEKEREKSIKIIELNIIRIEKESNDLLISINTFSKKKLSIENNIKEAMTYNENITVKYLSLEKLNNKRKIYDLLLENLKEFSNQKLYQKVV